MQPASSMLLLVVYTSGIFLSVILLTSSGIQELREFLSRNIASKEKPNNNSKVFKFLTFFLSFFKKSIECNICFSFWVNLFWLLYVNYIIPLIEWFELISLSFLYTICSIMLYGIINLIFRKER